MTELEQVNSGLACQQILFNPLLGKTDLALDFGGNGCDDHKDLPSEFSRPLPTQDLEPYSKVADFGSG